jgi:hypothetical protein
MQFRLHYEYGCKPEVPGNSIEVSRTHFQQICETVCESHGKANLQQCASFINTAGNREWPAKFGENLAHCISTKTVKRSMKTWKDPFTALCNLTPIVEKYGYKMELSNNFLKYFSFEFQRNV